MIGRLRGLLVEKAAAAVLIDVSGLGYEIAMTPAGLAALPPAGEEIVIHTHLHVREDVLSLYGFLSREERDLFRLLLGLSGVGPKLALAITATLTPAELRRAVAGDDAAALEMVPGVGKKTAQRLMLELQTRLDITGVPAAAGSAVAEVRRALQGLGYQQAEIRVAVADLTSDGEVGELLRAALQTLGSTK